MSFLISPYAWKCRLFLFFVMCASVIGVRLYQIVVLIAIPMMISNTFYHLYVFCKEVSVHPFSPFLMVLVFPLYSSASTLYILNYYFVRLVMGKYIHPVCVCFFIPHNVRHRTRLPSLTITVQ